MGPTRLRLVGCLLLLTGLLFPESSRLQPASPREHFVRGTVAVEVSSEKQKAKDIFLPHASVLLVRQSAPTTTIASTITDLSGRFIIKTQEVGVFMLCVEAEGFPRTCPGKEFRDPLPVTDAGTLRLPLFSNIATVPPAVAAAWGAVSLKDGKLARGFAPALRVNFYPVVELESKSGKKYRGEVNEFGEYVVPGIPVREEFVLRVQVQNQKQERLIKPETGLVPGRAYEFDFVLPNSAPRIRTVTAMAGGKPVQVANPGSTIDLHAVTDDPEGDKLEYRWLLPDGHIVGPTPDSVLQFAVPAQRGNFLVTVVATDQRGGFAQSGIAIRAEAAVAWFSGTVTDTFGQDINGALVEVNGRLTNTDAQGGFRLNVPLSDRYVMTIRSAGVEAPNQRAFGTASYVYKAPIMGGRWQLRRAQVATVDPTQAITLQQKRDERDCVGPTISRIDWTPYLIPNMVQWQDGRGNVIGLGDLGARDPKAVQGVMPSAARINPGLVKVLAGATSVRPHGTDEKLPCLPGVKVEIPANSLIDPSTSKAPTGPIQVALSTVALTTGDQMPGDYSALDSGNKLTAMESFGAGSIDIGAGGSRFNLKPGATATVTIPVDATQRAGGALLEPTIPFLYYDEQAGQWKQDGVATLTGGAGNPAYEKKVTHFSTMNADILKSGQACVAVELDPAAAFNLPLPVEVVLQPSKPNPGVIQVRTLTVDSTKSNVIYNLPLNSDIVLTPIVAGVLPDGSTGNVPAGVFVVNTGGPMNAAVVPPPANPDGTYYAESGGNPTGPCASRVTLSRLSPVTLSNGQEFLQGLYFEASNINEFNSTIGTAIDDGVVAYYQQADPRQLRNSFNLFKSKNRFGQPAAATEVEVQAHYANSGDLGFGRDMHCRRNVAGDGAFDYACYVTNFGQPPANNPDQQDANDVIDPTKHPDATVAMEFSRIENPPGPTEFPDNDRAVKFYVYDTSNPDNPPVHNADLDNHGHRPVPQLCMACHGGTAASAPADPSNPTGPKKGAFASRVDIVSMQSNFLPFDLHLYNFPAAEPKASPQVQAAFKSLNVDIVHGVAAATGTGGAIVEVIDTAFYANNAVTQVEDNVIAGWDPNNANSDQHRFYRDVFARACRTCHIARPFGAPSFTTSSDFEAVISNVQNRVCTQHIMPHAQRTNDIFWTSLNPNMAALLELYGQTVPGWSPLPGNQCSQGPVQGGGTTSSVFSSQIYPIMFNNCTGCHSAVGNAKFAVVSPATTYNQLLTTLANDGTSHYIVAHDPGNSLMYHRITTGGASEPNARMPFGGPNLVTADTDVPPDGIPDATEVNGWINAGAVGP